MTTEDGLGAMTSPAGASESPRATPPAEPVLPDMTARRLAEVVDRYRALVQVTGQITWTTTPEGTFSDASAWCTYTGQSPAEVQDWGGMEAIHPDDREQARRAFLESIATRTPYEAEYRIRRFDGEYRWFLARGVPIVEEDGTVREWVGFCTDITERRRLERRTHEALQALLQMAQALVLVPDERGDTAAPGATEVRSVGQRLVELTRRVLGCQRASIIAIDPATRLQHPVAVAGLSPEHERLWAQSLEGAPVDGAEAPDPSVVPRLRAGEAVILDLSAPPWDAHPNPFGIRTVLVAPMRVGPNLVGTLALDYAGAEHAFTPEEVALAGAVAQLAALIIERDHLLRKRAEAQGNELALRESNRRMDEFLAIASHELKTPLTSLKGFVQLAQRRAARTRADDGAGVAELLDTLGAVQRVLQRAGEQIDRMDRLASDLIDVSRIQAGRLEMRIARCDLAAIVRDAVDGQRHLDPARRIDERIPPDLVVMVDGDADRLGQVVTNYLTNALKYSTADKPVVVGLEVDERTARVWVRDEGPGIPMVEQEHIWEQFYRAPGIAYRSGSGVGLGMGLHISRTIVERHGGQAGVESVPGAGATFWFTIPCAAESEGGHE